MRLSGHAVRVLPGAAPGPAGGCPPGPWHTGSDVQVWCEGAHTLQPARGAVPYSRVCRGPLMRTRSPLSFHRSHGHTPGCSGAGSVTGLRGVCAGQFICGITACPAAEAATVSRCSLSRVYSTSGVPPSLCPPGNRCRRSATPPAAGCPGDAVCQPLFVVGVFRLMLPQSSPVSGFSTVCRSPVRRPLSHSRSGPTRGGLHWYG